MYGWIKEGPGAAVAAAVRGQGLHNLSSTYNKPLPLDNPSPTWKPFGVVAAAIVRSFAKAAEHD